MLIHQVFVAYDIIIITLVLSSNRHNNEILYRKVYSDFCLDISFGKVSSNKLRIAILKL